VSDLKFPAGIKAVRHGTQNPVVVAVTEPKVEEEAPAADVAAAPAAPVKGKGGKAAAPAKTAAAPAAAPAKKK
jgi:large subunit ribosomal protein L25